MTERAPAIAKALCIGLLTCLPAHAASGGFEVSSDGSPGAGNLVPRLNVQGPYTLDSRNQLELRDGLPASAAMVIVGLSALEAPFAGGVLGPEPDLVIGGLALDALGSLDVEFLVREPVAIGAPVWLQGWVADPAGESGLASTPTLTGCVQGLPLEPRFPALQVPSVMRPWLVRLADVNEDGNLDSIVASEESDQGPSLVVHLGMGDGRFGPPSSVQRDVEVEGLATGDVDADGHVDLVVIAGQQLVVWSGDGKGLFAQSSSQPVPSDARQLLLQDIDADNTLDALFVLGQLDEALVMLGNGTGGFAAPAAFPVSRSPQAPLLADVDGDGALDLVVLSQPDDQFDILIGDGAGGFTAALPVPTPSGSTFDVTTGDVDGDGVVDLITAEWFPDRAVSVLLGVGDGTFGVPITTPAPRFASRVKALHVDADEHLDIVVTQGINQDGRLHVLHGAGDGTFPVVERHSGGAGFTDLTIADVDNDGLLDLVSCHDTYHYVLVGLGDGAGFDLPRIDIVGGQPRDSVLIDANEDGTLDLAYCDEQAGGLAIALGLGGGAFDEPLQQPAGSSPYGLAAADLDGDGHGDLVTTDVLVDEARVFLGAGDGSFAPGVVLATGERPLAIVLADLDGDGAADLATANFDSGDVTLALGAGDGSFGTPWSLPIGSDPFDLEVADLDGDGIPDLLVSLRGASPGWLAVLQGLGGGAFGPTVLYTLPDGMQPFGLDVADLDGDDDLDVVLAARYFNPSGPKALLVFKGTGAGDLMPPQSLNDTLTPGDVTIADFDGDGRLDIAVLEAGILGTVSLLSGQVDGTFTTAETHVAGALLRSMVVSDFDDNGKLDVLVMGDPNYDSFHALLLHRD